jgi:hypothetical protein
MKINKPLQHLRFAKINSTRHELQASIAVLMEKGKSLSRASVTDEKTHYLIVYKTTYDDRPFVNHIFTDVVPIFETSSSGLSTSYQANIVKFMVLKTDGSVGGDVTTTISGNATIEID